MSRSNSEQLGRLKDSLPAPPAPAVRETPKLRKSTKPEGPNCNVSAASLPALREGSRRCEEISGAAAMWRNLSGCVGQSGANSDHPLRLKVSLPQLRCLHCGKALAFSDRAHPLLAATPPSSSEKTIKIKIHRRQGIQRIQRPGFSFQPLLCDNSDARLQVVSGEPANIERPGLNLRLPLR